MSSALLLLIILPLLPPVEPSAADTTAVPCSATTFDVDLYGRIVLADARKSTVTLLSPEGTVEATVGWRGWESGQFDAPAGVWMRNGIDIFVADYYNHRIQRFDRNLNFVSSLATRQSGNPDERFGFPTDVALSRFGELYVCDSENSRILKFNRSNTVERSFGGLSAGKGRLRMPTNLEIGPADRVYVLDGDKVQVFDGFGNYVRTIGEGLFSGNTVMSADNRGLVVWDAGRMFFFDADDSPVGVTESGEGPGKRVEKLRGLVVSGDDIYVLTVEGIQIARGVRPSVLTK